MHLGLAGTGCGVRRHRVQQGCAAPFRGPEDCADLGMACTSVSSCRWRVSDVGRLLDPYQPEVAVCTWLALPPPSHGLHPFRAMMMVLRIGCCSRLHRLHACGHIAARSASRLTPNLSRNQLGPSGLTVLVMVITWVGPNLGWASCTCIAAVSTQLSRAGGQRRVSMLV